MAQAKTIIGIPIKAKNEANIDNIVDCIKHNIRGLDREAYKLVIDTNGTSAELNSYFSTKLRPLKASFDIEFVPHEQADGRTASMNRIAERALKEEPGLNGLIYIADDILIAPQSFDKLAKALETHPVAGGMVKPLDNRATSDTTLTEQAILDFETRVRKKKPHLHGSFMGISGKELATMAAEDFFPPVHFDDDYLTVRYKLKNGLEKNVPMIEGTDAYIAMPDSWPEAINKVARYHHGDKQLADYYAGIGNMGVAMTLANMHNNSTKATAQFVKMFEQAERVAAQKPIGMSTLDTDYLIDTWQKIIPVEAAKTLPSVARVRDVLEKLVTWDSQKKSYAVAEPEITLPLLNSTINLLGIYKSETGFVLEGASWDRDGQTEISDAQRHHVPRGEPKIKSAIPEPKKTVGVAM